MKRVLIPLVITISSTASAAGGHYQLKLTPPSMIGVAAKVVFRLHATAGHQPANGLKLVAKLSMPSMSGMMLTQPVVAAGPLAGDYDISLSVPEAGRYSLTVYPVGDHADAASRAFTAGQGQMGGMQMQGMSMGGQMKMSGTYGPWSANREGSSTTWQPDSSPMFMKMIPSGGRWDIGLMGSFEGGYVETGGKRGSDQFFSDSMAMLMGRNETQSGVFGFELMTSLDPLLNGERGVPDLFQTGETVHSVPLVDRQHPHNLYSEVAGSYSHPLGKDWDAFLYAAPIGEPALGNVMFMHRPSGMDIPEAPISHHWFDSTHISFGVVTLGAAYQNKWKLEGSVFNGHEPGENRYTLGPIELNSASGRLSFNPAADWSFSTSYGYLNSPEATSPGLDMHRLTVSAAYSHNFSSGDNLSATAYWGHRVIPGKASSDAWLAEATLYHRREAIFGRFERVDEDELYNIPTGSYEVNKLLLGDVHTLYSHGGIDYGLGAYLGFYSFPQSLTPYYGHPVTWGLFVWVGAAKM